MTAVSTWGTIVGHDLKAREVTVLMEIACDDIEFQYVNFLMSCDLHLYITDLYDHLVVACSQIHFAKVYGTTVCAVLSQLCKLNRQILPSSLSKLNSLSSSVLSIRPSSTWGLFPWTS